MAMQFSTPVQIPASQRPIRYSDHILMLGSCFADNIAEQMSEYYFQITANPFGTLYNPVSIANALALTHMPELVEWGGLFHSMYHHGAFSSSDREQTCRSVEQSIGRMQQAWAEASVVIITFGTAWVYERNGMVVANCHKLPASQFTRRRLSVEDIVGVWQPILAAYPDKQFIFTVSPIRHIKDGLHQNQLSKATLLLAIDQLLDSHTAYFPSYEIMLDELRDYRFYADDMFHPSPLAVRYIWQRFADTYIEADTRGEMQTLHQLYLDRHHTLLHPDSPQSQAFLARLEERTASHRLRYPWI